MLVLKRCNIICMMSTYTHTYTKLNTKLKQTNIPTTIARFTIKIRIKSRKHIEFLISGIVIRQQAKKARNILVKSQHLKPNNNFFFLNVELTGPFLGSYIHQLLSQNPDFRCNKKECETHAFNPQNSTTPPSPISLQLNLPTINIQKPQTKIFSNEWLSKET